MMAANYWNHNSAYYPWVVAKTFGCQRVLDVGCGNGELAYLLAAAGHSVTGIDPSASCIAEARARESGEDVRFARASFESYGAGKSFDAIVFVASLHHMDMERTLARAKELLAPGGVIAVVGLASPSSALDHAIEVLRVVPSCVSSRLHRMRTSEGLGIPTSYELPTMAQVREVASRHLPGSTIRHGLHWRYLLSWRKT
jgi:2-polyprenyl-3-methyl-5-hydroxy-6-metoxy-1,4-benzoquinol methylase